MLTKALGFPVGGRKIPALDQVMERSATDIAEETAHDGRSEKGFYSVRHLLLQKSSGQPGN
jgi:hypothetical protein